jgi:hypothetical protein
MTIAPVIRYHPASLSCTSDADQLDDALGDTGGGFHSMCIGVLNARLDLRRGLTDKLQSPLAVSSFVL